MRVPLLDLHKQFEVVGPEILEALANVISSCQFINGPEVAGLEGEIADYVGSEFAIGVSSGTDALLVALMCLDVGEGDIVLTTPYSFFATAGAVSRLGATPAFVDIEPNTYNLCPQALKLWIENNTAKLSQVKACIPVHLYGQSADMDAIASVCSENEIPIIEDAAQAIGTKTLVSGKTRNAGAIGLMGCYSFFPSKNLGGIGDGGMVVTSDEETAAKLRKLKNHGSHPKYYHELIGGNFRLDAIQAAALRIKLKHLDDWHQSRQKNASFYDDALRSFGKCSTPQLAGAREHHIYNQYVISVDDRDGLRSFLSNVGVGTEVYYPVPFHLQECFTSLGYKEGDFPNAEAAARETLALPIYPELTQEMQEYVVDQIEKFYA